MIDISNTSKEQRINYDEILHNHDWIVEKNRNCIISPDTDGLLCALLMSHLFNWSVKGFYDGKVLLVEQGIKPTDTVFLDMEIFRKDVKSMGQHLLMPNSIQLTENWGNFDNCISPNNIRRFGAHKEFQQKFPFATIHFLLTLLGNHTPLKPTKGMIPPLLFVDGTFKNILNYPENCLSWLDYMRANDNTIMHKIFFNTENHLEGLMNMMKDFFHNIKQECGTARGSEKIKLPSCTVESDKGNHLYDLSQHEVDKTNRFLVFLADRTGWDFKKENWTWHGMDKHEFSKGIFESTSYRQRNEIVEEQVPLSYAITATNRMEYTLISNEQESLFTN